VNRGLLFLIISFIFAAIFFIFYNQYLIDRSLVNISISLNELEKTKDIRLAKNLKDILDDVFLNELIKEDIDLEVLLNIEFSTQIIDRPNRNEQLNDIKFFISNTLEKKEKSRNIFLLMLDKLFLKIFPKKRVEKIELIKQNIENLKKDLYLYKGKDLQKKYLELIRLSLRIRDFENAKDFCKKAIDIEPNSEVSQKIEFYLAFVYKLTGDFKNSSILFSKLKNSFKGELSNFSKYQEADSLYREGKTDEAIDLFKEIFKENPSSFVSQFSKFKAGYIYLHDLNDYNEAYEEFNELGSIEVGDNYIFKKDKDTANKYFVSPTTIISLNRLKTYVTIQAPTFIAKQFRDAGFKLLQEGFFLFKKDKYQEAALKFKDADEKFNLAIKFYPKDAVSFSNKAICFYFLKDKEKALEYIKKAQEITKTHPVVLGNIGYVYYNLGLNEEAIESYKKAILYSKDSSLLYYNLGTVYLSNNQIDKAIVSFNKAIELNPKLFYTYNNLGYLLYLKKAYKEAKINFERAISINPNYVDAHYNLGVLFFDIGEYKNAYEEFLIVEKLIPSYKKVSWYLTQTKQKLNL